MPTLALLLVLIDCLSDANRDGVVRVACLGDSNTAAEPHTVLRWCERAARRSRKALGVEWVNLAVPGVSACSGGMEQIDKAVAAGADIIIAAFGTNDLWHRPPPDALACYEQMADAAGNRQFYVALTPPTYWPAPDTNAAIDELNVMLREQFGENNVIDFASGMNPQHYEADGVHLNDSGHAKRARRVWAMLRRWH